MNGCPYDFNEISSRNDLVSRQQKQVAGGWWLAMNSGANDQNKRSKLNREENDD